MPRRVKKKSHEKLTDTNVQHVLELLKDDNPITKKEACSILNISYNTTRLTNIIDEYLERLDYKNKRKAQNKGKPAREDEIKRVIEDYLDGDSIIEIAAHIFRSPSFLIDFLNYFPARFRSISDVWFNAYVTDSLKGKLRRSALPEHSSLDLGDPNGESNLALSSRQGMRRLKTEFLQFIATQSDSSALQQYFQDIHVPS